MLLPLRWRKSAAVRLMARTLYSNDGTGMIQTEEVRSIQYLRGFAALMIVVFHILTQLKQMGYDGPAGDFLAGGVDVFFVISGFIMWYTTFSHSITSLQFIRRRLIRIIPLYWILTSLTVCILLISPSSLQHGRFDLYHVITSYLFIPSVHPIFGWHCPVLVVGWSLNYEMFFYLIFAVCLTLSRKSRLITVVAILVLLVSIQHFLPGPTATILYFYTSSIVLEFAFGVILGALYTANFAVNRGMALTLVILGVIGLGVVPIFEDRLPHALISGVPALLVVGGVVNIEKSNPLGRSNFIYFLGSVSYSLYLSHGIVLSATGQIWHKLELTGVCTGFVVFAVLSLVLAIAFAALLYRFIESPAINIFRQRRQGLLAI
jgi:exopolysaccharide production protein ExoZ